MQKEFKYPNFIVCLLILSFFLLAACDSNDNNSFPVTTGAPPGQDCLDASSNSNVLEENMDCLAEAVVDICTGFICELSSPGEGGPVARRSNLMFAPSNCEATSCFEFNCDSMTTDSSSGMLIETAVFGEYTLETVSGNVITGTVVLTDEETNETREVAFSCSPLVI